MPTVCSGRTVLIVDFSQELFSDMVRLAERFGLNLELNVDGQVRMPVDSGDAVAIAAKITDLDFPWGYVIPENDFELTFSF
jgi:hypothetical protein